MKIELNVVGLGNIPGKKNSKKIIRKLGTQIPMIITDPKIQRTCRRIEALFVSQLTSAIQTAGGGTSPTQQKQSLMHSLPQDDNWSEIPLVILSGSLCVKGEEGCTVTIEQI